MARFSQIENAINKSKQRMMRNIKKGVWNLTKRGIETSLNAHADNPVHEASDFHLHYNDAYGALMFVKGNEEERFVHSGSWKDSLQCNDVLNSIAPSDKTIVAYGVAPGFEEMRVGDEIRYIKQGMESIRSADFDKIFSN